MKFKMIVALMVVLITSAFASGLALADGDDEAYVALGDSVAVGVGASDPATTGYVPIFHEFLLAEEDDLALVNLGHAGDTSSELIAHGHLAAALAEIEEGDVEVVTLSIGGNDVRAVIPVCSGGLTPACVSATGTTFATFSGNFDFILSELRAAVDEDAPIIVMTYYNALVHPGCPLNPLALLGDIALEGGGPLLGGLNDLIRSIAASHGAAVADTFGLLGPAELQPDCIHPNDAGYEAIADEFNNAVDGEDEDEDDDEDEDENEDEDEDD